MPQDDTPADTPAMNEILDWLGSKSEDPLDDLIPLRRHLRAVVAMPVQPGVLLRLLDLFEPRIARIHKLVFPLLLDVSTPLPRNLRILSQSLVDLHGHLAEGFLKVLQHAVGEGFQRPRRRRDTLAARALTSLRRQYELSLRAASGTPPGFWKQLNQLLLSHQQSPDSDLDSPTQQGLRLLLAVHAAQADTLTPREQEFLWRHAEHLATQVEMATTAPRKTESWLWVDTHDERAPTPANRRAPPAADGLVFYSCRTLGKLTQASLDNLAAPRAWRNVLHHAAKRWLSPPQRRHNRRRGGYRVEVCPRLSSLWALLNGDLTGNAAVQAINEWQVMNDSPAGYAAMHISGDMPGLLAGSVLGIRRNDKEPWSLCIVRWVRSENPEHLEMGLEVLAPHAKAVRIGTASRPEAPIPALLLPPITGIGRGETLLTERGAYETGTIALMQEEAGKLQVAECKPLPLVTQTASIELFEFERLQHPGG
ncbi:MAG: hypothetical protein KGL40_04615 [Rhodocyclaceae bacterium]|nr:hypothetical protein [Rhodocyclaceae bacterium]